MQQKGWVLLLGIFSWVSSGLDYCSSLLVGTPSSVIQPMQKVQNSTACLILRALHHQHCTSLLQQLHWLPISKQIKHKIAWMCKNSITGSTSSNLSELLQLYSPSHSLHSSSDTHMLKLQHFNCKTHCFHSFSCFGPHTCNDLPQDVRHSTTLSSFKNKFKTFFFSLSTSTEQYCSLPQQTV